MEGYPAFGPAPGYAIAEDRYPLSARDLLGKQGRTGVAMGAVRSIRRLVTWATGGFVIAAVLAGCGGNAATSTQQTTEPVPRAKIVGVQKTRCPPEITGQAKPSVCKLAEFGVGLKRCSDSGAGGYDVMVSGLSCDAGRGLRLALGDPIGHYGHASQVVYRPWVATGTLSESGVKPSQATGWTCWAGFDPAGAQGIWHACWRGQDVLLFTTS